MPPASEIAPFPLNLFHTILMPVVVLVWYDAVGFLDSLAIPAVREQAGTVNLPIVQGTVTQGHRRPRESKQPDPRYSRKFPDPPAS